MLSYSKSFRSIRSHTENLCDRARRKFVGSFRQHASPNSDNFGSSSDSSKKASFSLFPKNTCDNDVKVRQRQHSIINSNICVNLLSI